jgi:hypothetical protein
MTETITADKGMSMRYEPQGLERYARFDIADFKHSMQRQQRSAYTWVFGAYVYCLKVEDYESAEWLRQHLDSVDEPIAASDVTRVLFHHAPLMSCREVQSERDAALEVA